MTDPLTIATTFATIVSLLGDFTSSRGHQDVLDIKEFSEWLRFHGHEEVLKQLNDNAGAIASLKATFAEGRDELLCKLVSLEQQLCKLTTGQGPLHDLALALQPGSGLSEQSTAILRAYEDAEAGKALVSYADQEPPRLLFTDGTKADTFISTEPRFFDTDLDDLVSLGLLSRGSIRGYPTLQLTRRGASIARGLRK